MIARRQSGRTSDFRRALAFLLGAILVGNLALLLGLDVRPSESALGGGALFAVLSWLAVGELVNVLLATLLGATLALAWRLVGATAALRRTALVSAYVYGGAWVGFCAGALMVGAAVQLIAPGLLNRVITVARGAAGADIARAFDAFGTIPFRGVMVGLLLLGVVIWLATLGWGIAAWGAYRQAFGLGRARALLAGLLWLALLVAWFALVGWLA